MNKKILSAILVIITVLAALIIITVGKTIRNSITDNRTYEDPHPNLYHLENEKYATPDRPVISPSGNYKMVIESGYNGTIYYNSFVIYSMADDTILFTSEAQYRTRDRLNFSWDENDNVSVYTADMGTFLWERDRDVWVNK